MTQQVAALSGEETRRLRWRAQLLGGSDLAPEAVVARAVALQGQDLPAVLRAIALRSRPGTTVADVRAAFDAGELVRSWPMRGTLFAITPAHLAALLHHTAERMHRAAARRRAELGLDEAVLAHARTVLLEALGAGPLTRAGAVAAWAAVGIDAAGGRGYHLIHHLATEGLVVWGPFDASGAQQLVRARLPAPEDPDRALEEVVRGFVAARGPVTEADLAWWTKLPVTRLRRAVAEVGDLVPVLVDGAPAWTLGEPGSAGRSGVTLVPGFDEWILGYADRSLHASPRALEALVPGGNGLFRPAVLVDGRVVGTWRLSRTSGEAPRPVVELVEEVPARTRTAVAAAASAWPYG